ncbi:MAG: CDP-alcohol phosphatidyltransferase family protein, partial [Nitrospira sp.]|nr:CDP-alcohol phosphatidyltransferase family protein [Nitrospira sp.]
QRLRIEGSQGKAVVVVGHPEEGHHRGNPGVAFRSEGLEGRSTSTVVFHDQALSPTSQSQIGTQTHDQSRLPLVGDLLVLPARLLGISGVLHANGTNPLRLALEQAAVEGAIQTLEGASHWFRDVRGPKGPQLAERTLLQALQTLKGGLDGLVDRYVNRKCSGLLTRGFLRLGWSPNTITMVSMVVGLVAAALFVPGSWKLAILGGLILQLSVIIDCCDGEVARLTFSESKFGQELDIWADN